MASSGSPCCYRDSQVDGEQRPAKMKLFCHHCRMAVSSAIPDDTAIRAIIMCPECWNHSALEREVLERCAVQAEAMCGEEHPLVKMLWQWIKDSEAATSASESDRVTAPVQHEWSAQTIFSSDI